VSDKKIELTQHAEDMLPERAIEADRVEQTVRSPESVEKDPVRPATIALSAAFQSEIAASCALCTWRLSRSHES
jgi:hypothetical protein